MRLNKATGLQAVGVLIAISTFLFVFVTPPFQAPDEDQHFYKSYQVSLGELLCVRSQDTMGAVLPASIRAIVDEDLPREQPDRPRRYTLAELARAWERPLHPEERQFVAIPNISSYPPTLYAAQAAAIAIGRTLGAGPLALLYMARLANAALGVALVLGAIALMPIGRTAMAAVAVMPTTLSQLGSASADASIIGGAFLATALALRLVYVVRLRPARDSAILFLTGAFLVLAKGVYGPLALAGVVAPRIPGVRPARRVGLAIAAFVVGFVCLGGWLAYSAGTQLPYSLVTPTTGQREMTAQLADQVRFVMAHPLGFAQILTVSFLGRIPIFAVQIVGRLGWNGFMLPGVLYVVAAAVFVFGAFGPVEAGRPTIGQRAWWALLVVGGAMLIETALYLTGTPLASPYVQGPQGRYFTPYLPLLGLVLLAPRGPGGRHGASHLTMFLIAAVVLDAGALATALDSFWLHGFTVKDGFPPFVKTVEGLIRVAVLPSPRW